MYEEQRLLHSIDFRSTNIPPLRAGSGLNERQPLCAVHIAVATLLAACIAMEQCFFVSKHDT